MALGGWVKAGVGLELAHFQTGADVFEAVAQHIQGVVLFEVFRQNFEDGGGGVTIVGARDFGEFVWLGVR